VSSPARAALAAAALTGLALLLVGPLPETGDQALFRYGARVLADGGTLYLDFWDNKQPGVYWFRRAAAELFGDGERGVFALYVLWSAATAGVLAAAFARLATGPPVWLATALATGAAVAARAQAADAAQVESLVPLFEAGVFALMSRGPRARGRALRWLAAGVLAAGIAVFKLLLAPIAIGMMAVAWWHASAPRERLAAPLVGAAGFLAVLGAVAWGYAHAGALGALVWTTLDYPALALRDVPRQSLALLRDSVAGFALATAPLAPAALLGLRWALIGDARTRLAAQLLIVWLTLALLLIGAQTFSWWHYHFVEPIWPVGGLAVLGISAASGDGARLARARRAAALVLTVGVAALLAAGAWRARGLRADDPRAWIPRSLARVEGAPRPCGTVYVFGNPRLLIASGLRQAMPTNGWSWERYADAQLRRLPSELAAAQPDWVYVDRFYRRLLRRRVPEALALLARDYRFAGEDEHRGRWWVRAAPRAQCPPPLRFEPPAE
jgi:hypothetical protein